MMDTLQDLVTACQANENLLRQQAQARTESWQPWLAPVSATRPREEVPGYDDDSQLIREEVNKLSGIRRGLISGHPQTSVPAIELAGNTGAGDRIFSRGTNPHAVGAGTAV